MRPLLILAALAVSGCAGPVVYVYPEITIPPPPELPIVTADELACLSNETYTAVAVRDSLTKGYAKQIRAIIEEHNRRAE